MGSGVLLIASTQTSGIGQWLLVLGIGAISLVIGLLIDFLRSFFSGWMGLAKVYRRRTPPRSGPVFPSCEYAYGTWLQSQRSERTMLTEEGVYLRTDYRSFRPFHPPLMLPWSHFERMEVYSSGLTQQVMLEFEDPAGRSLRVPLPKAAIPLIRKLSGRNDFSGEALR